MKSNFKILVIGAALAVSCVASAAVRDAEPVKVFNINPQTITAMAFVSTPVPDFTLITLAEAKAHLRLDADFTAEDALLQGYIDAAVGAASNYLGRAILNSTLEYTQDNFNVIPVDDWRMISIGSVTVLYDGAEGNVAVPIENYFFSAHTDACGKTTPALYFRNIDDDANIGVDQVTVTLNATVPFVVKQACLLTLADFYEIREDRGEINGKASIALLRPYRIWY